MIRELIEINRYLHDFTSAMWVCGTVLLWLMWRETRQRDLTADADTVLRRLAAKLKFLTLPGLAITLATGGVRALTFSRYEYVGEITATVLVTLMLKHIAFVVLIVWGISVHRRMRINESKNSKATSAEL